MFCSKQSYIVHLYKYQQLLELDAASFIMCNNIYLLAIEMYKVTYEASNLSSDIFLHRYNRPHTQTTFYYSVNPKSNTYGLRYHAPKIWSQLPSRIKALFKSIPVNDPCKICSTYIPKVGFV